MRARIAILAALPREIEPLVRDWPSRKHSRTEGTLIAQCDRAIAVCAGMGPARVEQALILAEGCGPVGMIISVGFAGAVRDGIARNTLHWPATVVDTATEARYECVGGSGILVTTEKVLGREEKKQMAERWNADLVDMEAATLARLAGARGVPFRALKVVSDEASDKLPDLNHFIDAKGGFREFSFAGHLALHPWLLPAVVRLGRNSQRAAGTLAQALHETIEHAD